MKANEFVKKFGWGYVINVVKNWNQENPYLVVSVDNCTTIHIDDLKRLVESYELVESYGGCDLSKEVKNITPLRKSSYDLIESLKQAIADMESCQ